MAPIAGFHLHFYQPPREDPWLGLVENEWSAWPYHDWNERIAAECYRAMIAVALPGEEGAGTELFEPLAASSFDVGPTLHSWLDVHAPDVARALHHQVHELASSPATVAMAAPLVHAILPLASSVDRERLVAWGIVDYTQRFGAPPVGFWLPETAVDLATLASLVDQGIRYTILMPTQAVRVRANDAAWESVDQHSLDTSLPYLVRLEDGRTITVVFGHSDLSHRVAFGDLTEDGSQLADTMIDELEGKDGVVLIVADGETYGHHHHFADVGLAFAVRRLARDHGVETAVGEWLRTHEPTHEVELAEVSAWSCAHGVERWRSDCGCVTGEEPGFTLTWRQPLREALDWLRAELGAVVDERLAHVVHSSDETLRDYGEVLAGVAEPAAFVSAHAREPLSDDETIHVLELCEVQRNLLFAFTSCAWFFADPAEIETSIVLRYASVAVEIARRVLGVDFEAGFVERLSDVRSIRPGVFGAELWRRACEGYRFSDASVAAGFCAEQLACGEGARQQRGFWRASLGWPGDRGGSRDVVVTNQLTTRSSTFRVRAVRSGALGVQVDVADTDSARRFRLVDLGGDVAARVVAAWLVEPGSEDFALALDLLAADLLERSADDDDVTALLALAGASRYVSPASEGSIRRALTALANQDLNTFQRERLAPLARAVGLGDAGDGPPDPLDSLG